MTSLELRKKAKCDAEQALKWFDEAVAERKAAGKSPTALIFAMAAASGEYMSWAKRCIDIESQAGSEVRYE